MPEENRHLIPNSTQIPNLILDKILPLIPEGEGKCLLYICRRTFGFHKLADRISFTQFMKGIKTRDGKILDFGAGLSRSVVSESLSNLTKAGAILVQKDFLGNRYEINLSMVSDEVVRKVNQYRKHTRIGRETRPKAVRLPY